MKSESGVVFTASLMLSRLIVKWQWQLNWHQQ